jgi:hypothetical protein
MVNRVQSHYSFLVQCLDMTGLSEMSFHFAHLQSFFPTVVLYIRPLFSRVLILMKEVFTSIIDLILSMVLYFFNHLKELVNIWQVVMD